MASVKRIKASDGTGNASVATVQTIRAALATTQTVDTVVGIYAGAEGFYATMGTPHTFTDPITSEVITVISDATAVDFQGHIDTGHIIIDAIAPGYVDVGSKVGDIIIIRPTTQWSNNASDTLAIAHNDDGTIKAPEGQLFNGQIVPTVASNNLTVAIKTLANVDPSATDPVYVRIGNTVRSITAALSVTLAAGTDWFSRGLAPWAATAQDYFVYIGYNSTDGVVMGVSTTMNASYYNDFSTTNTDLTYAKISNVAHAAATDKYNVVNRFNAILGVSATFLWTLPAGAAATITNEVIGTPAVLAGQGVWWQELGRTNLAAVGNTMTVNFTPKRYLMILVNTTPIGGTGVSNNFRFNNDSGANYSIRASQNGAADTTGASQTSSANPGPTPNQTTLRILLENVLAKEKFAYVEHFDAGTAGAANVPTKIEAVVKWANTSAQINRIDVVNTGGTGTYSVGDEVIVLGHD